MIMIKWVSIIINIIVRIYIIHWLVSVSLGGNALVKACMSPFFLQLWANRKADSVLLMMIMMNCASIVINIIINIVIIRIWMMIMLIMMMNCVSIIITIIIRIYIIRCLVSVSLMGNALVKACMWTFFFQLWANSKEDTVLLT